MAASLAAPGVKFRKRRKVVLRRLRVAVALMMLANLAVWSGVIATLRGVDVQALLKAAGLAA